ncbi:MAG TPA: hypothetical protein VFJ85_00705 [Acidimicrobiales bacterium]|nr:hypothetical protein [Acidimicrobiales bacterium]
MPEWTTPWAPGASTGLGPLPGTDPAEATAVAFGEAPDLPFLPELPGRGAGAEAVGRTAALLVGLHADVFAGRWRLVARQGRDERLALELLERDLDALEALAEDHPGPVKIEMLGPWSLAAALERPRGDKALADAGAVRDLAESLAEGVAGHAVAVRRRLPRVERLLVQLDEPFLPAVLRGELRSASGWSGLPVPEAATVEEVLAGVMAAAGPDAGVWCDAPEPPLGLLRRAGAMFVACSAEALDSVPEEEVGDAIEAGAGILLGLVPAPTGARPDPHDLASPARRIWSRLGLGHGHWDGVVVTEDADLAVLSDADARSVLARCRDVARSLRDEN